MAIADKVDALVSKYGLNYRGYFLSTLVFPPAGMYVGWKMPGASLAVRLVLIVSAVLAPIGLALLIGAALDVMRRQL
jgi:hypothetical protein